MKLSRLSLALSAFLAIPAFAQSTDSTNQPAATPPAAASKPAPPNHPPPLTKEEQAEVAKAYAAATKTNPELAKQQTALLDKMKTLQTEQKDLDDKILAAMGKADPDVAPILAAHPNVHPPRPSMAPKAKPTTPPATTKPATKPKKPATTPSTNAPSTNAPSATPPSTN